MAQQQWIVSTIHQHNRRREIKRVVFSALAALLLVPTVPAPASPEGSVVQTVKGGLNFPVDMTWVPGTGTIFFTEQDTGKIRELNRGELRPAACVNLKVDPSGEQGLLGISLDPNYSTNHYLYVYFSSKGAQDNRVARFEVVEHVCTDKTFLLEGIPDNTIHNGGQLEFVDGYLFVSTGDVANASNSQNLNSLAGKILRINSDGTIPEDNPALPAAHPAVWSYGHRNTFGLAARSDTGQLLQSENGPGCDDEVNIILPGENYGWGPGYNCTGPAVGVDPMPPLREWTPTIAPTDVVFYEGRLDALDGTLLMGDYNRGRIHRFELSKDGMDITDESIVHNDDGAIIDVAKGPGGWVYYLTETAIKRIKEVP